MLIRDARCDVWQADVKNERDDNGDDDVDVKLFRVIFCYILYNNNKNYERYHHFKI